MLLAGMIRGLVEIGICVATLRSRTRHAIQCVCEGDCATVTPLYNGWSARSGRNGANERQKQNELTTEICTPIINFISVFPSFLFLKLGPGGFELGKPFLRTLIYEGFMRNDGAESLVIWFPVTSMPSGS